VKHQQLTALPNKAVAVVATLAVAVTTDGVTDGVTAVAMPLQDGVSTVSVGVILLMLNLLLKKVPMKKKKKLPNPKKKFQS
jgi:hypothetical protein